jgi:hypothetical protein
LYTAAGLRRAVAPLVVAFTSVRIAAALWAGLANTRGDYYAAMPGAYVKAINPTLWNSPDLQGAWGYHLDTYFHGPTQFLTLYPVAYLDSYAQIAAVLLPIYALVLAASFWVIRLVAHRLAPGCAMGVPLFAATFLFFPLLQALIQREFEVVTTFALILALWCLLADRRAFAGVLLGYVAWFKYVPLLFLGYLGLRRWVAATAMFIVASAAILGVSELLFGLSLFVNNNVPGHASQVFNITSAGFAVTDGHRHGVGFCSGWFASETTLTNIRHGLCTIASNRSWFAPHVVYLTVCAGVALFYLKSHARLQRRALSADLEAWRRALEFAIVVTVVACFFFAHYYYLIMLVIPFNILLMRYWPRRRWQALAVWAFAYACVSAFVVPIGMLSKLLGIDMWAAFISGAWFLYGELALVGLLVYEYWQLGLTGAEPGGLPD